eukprot:589626-Hanusia_phi.AAC.1
MASYLAASLALSSWKGEVSMSDWQLLLTHVTRPQTAERYSTLRLHQERTPPRNDGIARAAVFTPGVYRSLSATASSSSLERFSRRVASGSS